MQAVFLADLDNIFFFQVDTYDVTVAEDLGELQLIKIEKRKYWFPDDWYLKYVTVKTPIGDYLEFPCYRWITDEKEVVLRDGRGKCFAGYLMVNRRVETTSATRIC